MKYCLHLFYLFILFSVLSFHSVHAQSLKSSNLSGVNVDELSDVQVRQIMNEASSQGLDDTGLQQLLQAKGMSAGQIQKLQSRIRLLASSPQRPADTLAAQGTRRLNYQPDTATASRVDSSRRPAIRVFGADLFRGSNMSFEPNLRVATPVNYILGPDDQLNINVYGNSLVDWRLTVSPEGTINIPGVGVVNVSGRTVEQATSLIKSRLAANNYAIGRGTNVNVSLGNIRSIKVIVVGEAVKPGTYTLPSLATAFNALYAAGGPNDNGSFRQIEIIRK